jgi:hypothetical protein
MLLNTCLLHDKYVIVSADKAPNNIVFVCKSHYIDCLIKELGIDNSIGNPIYTPTTLTKDEIRVLTSFTNILHRTRVWRYQRVNQSPFIEEEQTTQWPKEPVQKDKQRSTKHTYN